jgi:hypothetical protein
VLQTVERDRGRQDAADRDDDPHERPRPREPGARPERKSHERDRYDVEDVALVEVLHAVHVERGADERDADQHRQQCGERHHREEPHPLRRPAEQPHGDHHGGRRQRRHRDVQREVAHEVREPLRDLAGMELVERPRPGAEPAERPVAPGDRGDRRGERCQPDEHERRADAREIPPALGHCPRQREQTERSHIGADQRHALDARERDDAEAHQSKPLVRCARLADRSGDQEHGQQEHRVERVLGHDDAAVGHRRHEHREEGDEEGGTSLDEHAREEIGGHRRQGHQQRVDAKGDVVRPDRAVEQRPRRRDQRGVHLAPAEDRHASDRRTPACRDALRELRVDDLVGEDPDRRDGEADRGPNERRDGDDRGQACGSALRHDGHARRRPGDRSGQRIGRVGRYRRCGPGDPHPGVVEGSTTIRR